MPRNIVAGAIIELALVGRHEGQRTLNLLHYAIEGGGVTPVDYTPYAADFVTQLNLAGGLTEKYLNCCSNDFTLESIRVQVVDPTRYSFQTFTQIDAVGNVEDEALPPNDGVTIEKKNQSTGRHNRGSIHLPGVPKTFVSNGFLTTAAVVAYTAFANELLEAIPVEVGAVELTHRPVIFNRENPTLSPLFDETDVKLTSRVNRRRTVGVGE